MKMPFINIKRSLWTIGLSLCLLVISNGSQAQRRPVTYTKTLSGAVGELAKDSSRTVIDSIYFHRLLFPKVDTTMSIDNMIVFYIDETSLRMPPDSFKVDLEVKIYFRNRDSIYDSINSRTLSIDYYKDRPYKSKAVYLFSNAPSVQVKVVNITTSYTTTANILPLLKLENRMAINRIFELDCSNTAITSISSNTTPVATKGELNVSWASINAAQEYDLEWTFVDQSALDSNWYLDGGVLSPALLFENNATRVTIAKNTYNIPLLYEGDGKLFFRVRAAQTELDGERKTTAWSSDYIVEGGLGEYTMTGHERKLNWQSSTSFAEEGKRKSVVQYFDGTLRNRQTVTKDNTTDTSTTIVAETLYDRQGRSKIQVLPSPSLKTIIEYNPLFNRAVGGIEYDKDKYDLLVNPSDYCETQAPPMDSVNDGASKYYSANNPDKDKLIHRYIPTASGYPFTEVKYTQDNTGRISSQGGVGPDFQLASGHETRYYYGTPEQRDLDALFGTEVGYASHYQKNMVRDANGQYSVSYVDMHGRTVATALAGRPPASMDTLSSYDSVMRVDNLLDRSNNIIKGKTIESTKGLVVTADGNHTFIYTLDPESLSLKDKNNVDICYDCLYDLTITITGECKNNGTPNLTLPYVFRDSNMQVAAPWYDSTCTTARKFRDTIRVYLKEGSYVITKTLTLREDGMNWYRDSLYTPHNTVRTREQIIQEQLQQIRQRQGTCTDEPVTLYQYQAYREQVLLDMTPPYGQYAKYQYPKEGNIFSIFDPWFGGLRLYQTVSYGDITPNPASYSPQEFINNFQPEWAEHLARRYHPEWKALMVVEGLKSSYHWDEKFESTDTYAEATALGYLNPLNSASSPASLFTYGSDSMFLNPTYNDQKNDLNNNMFNYQNNGGENYSLWAMANIIGHCDPRIKACIDSFRTVPSNLFNSSVLQCTGERDMAWRFFRDQYLYLKRKEINLLIQKEVTGVDADAIRVFPDPAVAFTEGGNLVSSDLATAQQAAKDSLAASINSTCKAYAERWWQQLQSCNYSKADSIAIIPLLIEVCKQGGDSTHPYGASTVTPSSTYAYRSFEDVINQYNQSHGIATNAACNAFLIDAPGPYNKPMALADLPVYSRPDSCACDKISTLYSQYQTSSGYTSFSDYIQQTLHTTIASNVLDSLRNLCSGAISCRYITNPLTLPPALQCGTGYDVCVDCEQVNTVYSNFKTSYPGTIPSFSENTVEQQNSNHLFSSYMNSKLGFGKSAQEYLSFLDTCGVSFGCDSLQALVKRYNMDISPFRVRAICQSNSLTPSLYLTDISESVTDGTLHWPKAIRDTATGYFEYFQHVAGSQYCLKNGYAIEFKFKFLKNDIRDNEEFFYFSDANGGFVLYRRKEGAVENRGIFLSGITAIDSVTHQPINLSNENTLISTNPDLIFQEWTTMKYEVTPDSFRVYANGQLLKRVPRAETVAQLTNWSAFTYSFMHFQGVVDWTKIYDASGKEVFFDDYLTNTTRQTIDPSFVCPAPATSCETSFANYFNQQKGTSYTYGQIDSIYYATCGKKPDVCFSAFNKDTLNNTLLNYNATSNPNRAQFKAAKYGTGEEITDNRILFNSGSGTFPQSHLNAGNGWYNLFQITRSKSICGGNFYDVEYQLRFPPNDKNGCCFYLNGYRGTAVFGVRSTGIYLEAFTNEQGYNYGSHHTGADTSLFRTILAEANLDKLYTWNKVRLRTQKDAYQVYLNNKFIIQIPRDSTLPMIDGFYQSVSFIGTDFNLDWIKISKNDTVAYFEDFNDPYNPSQVATSMLCTSAPDCQTSFTNYFNQRHGTSYTFTQLDSLYAKNGLLLMVCGIDTTTITCNDLSALQEDYKNQYLQPASGYVDLDMRTFAGNKTPDEGPKGVFDIKGKLLGNTVDSTPTVIKQSYVNIWNSSADNRETGTLSLLQNGKFRLTLNPGKSAPCEGLIGQRYYQFDVVSDSLVGLLTGLGSYIDFGDSTKEFYNPSGIIGGEYRTNYPDPPIVHSKFITHTYLSPGQRPVTVYHTDLAGFVGFDCFSNGNCGLFNNVKTLRGYFPQNLITVVFHATHDSTLTNFTKIRNFNQISSIKKLDCQSHAVGLRNLRFSSFQLNKNLRELILDNDVSLGLDKVQKIDQYLPNLPANFPLLSSIILGQYDTSFSGKLNFTLPELRYLQIGGSHTVLTAAKIDEIINQVARGSLQSNGVLVIQPSNGASRSSASDSAITALTNRDWTLYGAGMSHVATPDSFNTSYPAGGLPFFTPFSDFINAKLNTNLTAKQVDSLYLAKCGHKPVTCPPADTSLRQDLLLCGKNEPTNPTLTYDDIYDPPCSDSSILAYNSGTEIYNAYKDSLDQSFNQKYAAKCLKAASIESFKVQRPVSEYHYTLYYYDQAGNLVKTIPPKGVKPNRDSVWLDSVALDRTAGLRRVPVDSMQTVYRYNSLNQVVSQQTPDAGKSTNWYDRLGRLAVSQNAQQLIDGKYSYTVYDSLGRIEEVGQKPQTTAMTNTISRNPTSLFNWIYFNTGGNAYGAEMVTRTVYDFASVDGTPCVAALQFTQKAHTLRNRVSYTRYFEKPSYAYNATYDKYFITGLSYTSGIDYSYDIHGNVDTMRNLYGSNTYSPMTYHGTNACKTIAYTYDLISGKVNEVHYNPGQNDEFYHRYEYDPENRLTDVYTTDNKKFLYQQELEEREAKYHYYKHGPLARTIIGQQQVQGVDYIYTLQGWLKGINGNSIYPAFDPGGDARVGANPYVATDAIGLTLRYYNGDYKAINSTAPNPFPAYSSGLAAGTYKPLYNGNISATTTSTAEFGSTHLYNYRYDQLNRLVAMDTYRGFNSSANHWNSMVSTFLYRERYKYDANGNITRADRNGNLTANPLMDSLYYRYVSGTNKLEYVDDYGVAVYGINTDLKDQSAGNYTYDAIGNLKTSVNRVITDIKWNVYGKIEHIQKGAIANATAQDLHFNYDPSGNRIGQFQRHRSGAPMYYNYIWYVRDAQGNVLAVYKVDSVNSASAGTLKLAEHHMYGSSRLGIINRDMDVDQPKHTVETPTNLGDAYLITFNRGNKLFEISNHLGNVMLTVSDKRLPSPVVGNPSVIASYTADVVTAVDYSPFGMSLPGRIINNHWQKYRYGFNGKESDNEVNGPYNELDYGMRVYDPRVGRFLSVDPITNKYPELSPYQYASNSPISGIDRDGLEWYYYNYLFGWKESQYPKTICYSESYMNKFGYYSAQQVHKFQEQASVEQEKAKAIQQSYDLIESKAAWERSRNLLGLAYELSAVKSIYDASQYASEGQYKMATIAAFAGAADLGPLFRTFGKGYGAVARKVASQFTTEGAWKLGNFARGAILEVKAAGGYISKGYEWLAESASPFFKTIDFYNAAEKTAVSLKTVNAEGNFGFVNIFENIENLANMRKVGSTAQFGVERSIQNVELHIAVPKGYDKSVLKDVEKAAKKADVRLEYVTIPE